MGQHIAGPAQVEIGVLRQVDVGWRIGHRLVLDLEIEIDHGVSDLHVDCSGIAFFTVGARPPEYDALSVAGELRLPHPFIESPEPSVKMMRRFVCRHAMLAAVDRESRVCDAVRVSTDDRAKVGGRVDVRLEAIETQDHIRRDTTGIGHRQRGDDASVGQDVCFNAARARSTKRDHIDRRAVREIAEFPAPKHRATMIARNGLEIDGQ